MQANLAVRRRLEAGDDFQESGLSAPAAPDQAEELPRRDRQHDLFQGVDRSPVCNEGLIHSVYRYFGAATKVHSEHHKQEVDSNVSSLRRPPTEKLWQLLTASLGELDIPVGILLGPTSPVKGPIWKVRSGRSDLEGSDLEGAGSEGIARGSGGWLVAVDNRLGSPDN